MPQRPEAAGEEEGTPLVFLEASACGKPVIAGQTGGAPDLVTHGVTGLCIDGTDLAAVTDAIRGLLADREFASRLGAAGLARARASAWEQYALAFVALLLGHPAAPPPPCRSAGG